MCIYKSPPLLPFPFSFSLKVRESKPQRNTGLYCYHSSHSDKLCSIISLCCSCLFCRGILISFGMSGNKSFIVRQEVSLTTKIRGHAQICQLHLNMRRTGLQAKHKGESRNKCSAGHQNKVQHPCTYSCFSHISLHMDFWIRQAKWRGEILFSASLKTPSYIWEAYCWCNLWDNQIKTLVHVWKCLLKKVEKGHQWYFKWNKCSPQQMNHKFLMTVQNMSSSMYSDKRGCF